MPLRQRVVVCRSLEEQMKDKMSMTRYGIHALFVASILAAHLGAKETDAPVTMLPDEKETPRLTKWMSYRYGLFIHFNNNIYGKGQHPGSLPVSAYKPVKLDVESWVRMAKDAGMRYAVLTVKHDGGFCLWDSKVEFQGKEFEYDVAASEYKTDVVRAFLDACAKYEIAPGFYYSLADTYANRKQQLRAQFKAYEMPNDAFEHAKSQLLELMTRYPECEYYWLDIPRAATLLQQGEIYDLLRRTNLNHVVLMNSHVAAGTDGEQDLWEKQEHGLYPSDVLNSEAAHTLPKGTVSKVQNWKGKKLFHGYEHCDIAGAGWFKTKKGKSVSELFALYKNVRMAGGNLLLNVGPTADGTMPGGFGKKLKELRKLIEPFEESLRKRE